MVPLISFVALMLKRSQSNQKGCDEECEGVESLLRDGDSEVLILPTSFVPCEPSGSICCWLCAFGPLQIRGEAESMRWQWLLWRFLFVFAGLTCPDRDGLLLATDAISVADSLCEFEAVHVLLGLFGTFGLFVPISITMSLSVAHFYFAIAGELVGVA